LEVLFSLGLVGSGGVNEIKTLTGSPKPDELGRESSVNR
jgi:hypothetical protein